MSLVHCVVIEDISTGEVFKYRPNQIQQALEKLQEADVLIGQNIIGYDLPALKKLYDWEFHGKVLDTLIMSRLSNTNRPIHPKCPTSVWDEHNQKNKLIGPHTLMNLGYYAGVNKGDFGEDAGWDKFSEEMLQYCVQDVKVNVAIYHMLTKELNGFSDYSIELEMDIAKYLVQQQANGWTFDINRAYQLEAELSEKIRELEDEVHKTFTPLPKFIKTIQPRAKTDGSVSSVGLKFLGDEFESIVPAPERIDGEFGVEYTSGEFTRVDWPEFNLGSRQQIAEQLMHRGWVPQVRTPPSKLHPDGVPVVSEVILESIRDSFDEATLLANYFMISKRQSMVNSWIDNYNEDTGCIHGYTNTLGTATGRMSCSKPNLQQVPASKVDKEGNLLWGFEGDYGADCRALFTTEKGYTLVGGDASALELRTLSHYLNDPEYTDQVLNGDIHTYNQKAAGLDFRSQAKTMIYCFLYGGGDAKLGAVVGGGAKEGKALKKKFLTNIPALRSLRENVLAAAERGWLKALDGRRLRIRSPHSALNFLLQGAGAIVMKVVLRHVMNDATETGLDFKLVGSIHDEYQFQVLNKDVEPFKDIFVKAFIKAGDELKCRCRIDGEAMSGDNWASTH